MGRFDRQEIEGRDIPVQLDRAADDFRQSLERQVRSILQAATVRAADLEREAERDAARKQEESEAAAQKLLEAASDRISRVLDSVELVENALSGMLSTLRSELTELAPGQHRKELAKESPADQEIPAVEAPSIPSTERPATKAGQAEAPAPRAEAPPAPAPRAEAPPAPAPRADAPPAPAPQAEAPRAPAPQAESPPTEPPREAPATPAVPPASKAYAGPEAPPPPKASPQPTPAPNDSPLHSKTESADSPKASPELDQMIRSQVQQMARAGKPRADVERFLRRFRIGENYLGMLDDYYGDDAPLAPPKGGMLSRLRRRRH